VDSRRGLFVAPFDALADPGVIGDLAVAAEQAGWDGFFVWDHMLYAPPVQAIADPWICCAVVAVRTERLIFGPMVTPLPRRRPQVLARQAASIERLAPGRLVLGFGMGDDWGSGEFARFGDESDPRMRGQMLDEGLQVLTALLSGQRVEHEGRHYAVRGVTFLPAPEQPIPIWIAGRYPNPAPLRRAVRYDGTFPIDLDAPEDLANVLETIESFRTRPSADYAVVVDLPPGADAEPWSAAGATWVLNRVGPRDLDLDEVRRFVERGPA
jgi:alkanesulfonate monooxygenase SsuD/methylene tetrahydromethanopterin reductase-like flavin-dependent oxidoreductase (luciferase family)